VDSSVLVPASAGEDEAEKKHYNVSVPEMCVFVMYVCMNEIFSCPTYLGHINHIAFDDFQKSMLHTLSGNISTDTNIPTGLADFVGFVNVYDTLLTSFNVLTTFKVQFEEDRLYIFSDISSLC
jgi:hypothetical protein